jgi:hypothetical protein
MGSADEHLGTQAGAQGNVSTRAQITSLQVFRTTCVVGAKMAQNSFPLWLFQHRGRSAVSYPHRRIAVLLRRRDPALGPDAPRSANRSQRQYRDATGCDPRCVRTQQRPWRQ